MKNCLAIKCSIVDNLIAQVPSTCSRISSTGFSVALALVVSSASMFSASAFLFAGQVSAAEERPAVDSSKEKIVNARQNDTFATIAFREFGSSSMGRHLAEYNGMSYVTVFTEGYEIRVPTSAEPVSDYAEIVFSKGDVLIYPGGSVQDSRPAKNFRRIHTNDIIETGKSGFLSLRFETGTIVNVQPLSKVILEQLECTEVDKTCELTLNATEGGIQADVEHRTGQPVNFIINTPYASAAVRGTVFDFDANSERTLVGVTEGSVDMRASGEILNLPQGLGVKAEKGRTPDTPVRLLKSPRFLSTAPRITREDLISWFGDAKTANYQLSVSDDPEGNREQYRVVTEEAIHNIMPLAAGEYHLNVRSTDAEGFKGYIETQKLNVVTLDEKLKGPPLALDQTGGIGYISVVAADDSQEEFEIQFSLSKNFDNVVSVDVPLDGGAAANFEGVTYFARARVLKAADEVSRFGPVLEIAAN